MLKNVLPITQRFHRKCSQKINLRNMLMSKLHIKVIYFLSVGNIFLHQIRADNTWKSFVVQIMSFSGGHYWLSDEWGMNTQITKTVLLHL